MSTPHHDHVSVTRQSSGLSRPLKTALLMIGLVGGFYLLREHWNHLAGNWVYLLLLACPLMHVFMHRGHHSHQHGATPETKQPPPRGGDQS